MRACSPRRRDAASWWLRKERSASITSNWLICPSRYWSRASSVVRSSPCSLLRHGPCFQEPNACKAILHFAKGSQHRLPIDGHVFLILRETIVQLSASGAAIEKRQRQRSSHQRSEQEGSARPIKIRPSSADSNPPEAVRSSLGKKAAFAIPIRALAAAIARSAAAMSGRRSNRLEGRPGGMETTTFSISLTGTEKSAGSFPSISPGHSLQSRAGGRQQAPRCARFPTRSALAKHQTRLPARPRDDRAPIGMTHHAASRPWRISPSLRPIPGAGNSAARYLPAASTGPMRRAPHRVAYPPAQRLSRSPVARTSRLHMKCRLPRAIWF